MRSPEQTLTFVPPGLTSETVLQTVALYRRGTGWLLDAIGQGYSGGLAAFATEHGIDVAEPEPAPAPMAAPAAAPAVSIEKVSISLTKDSRTKTAQIDLRKGQAGWVLTVGLEWDGRGAVYDRDGTVKRYGKGDLDVYFFCRKRGDRRVPDHQRGEGAPGRSLDLAASAPLRRQPGARRGGRPAVEEVEVRPVENGDLLVNVYQSVDNGGGAIDAFGRPRIAIRYGRAGSDGKPGPDANEILVEVGNGKNSFWATVAHIDVQDGVLTVDGTTRYSRMLSEKMPGLDTKGRWVQKPQGGPRGRSKKRNGTGLDSYSGRCQRG